ncbi:Glycosyl hydrolases family 16 [Mucilaginibacter mallensis]|uniref:Glycosyl hydrolases family 16 n=1 Tax=Mucilaginibacter mallensis TaxID=652787 RepID=A0A1H1W3H8_MUCMA|nr:glycoside hydrolase family 16 protein [Mucilaginibacter mallensis]SDS91848.1 Glycosyl hydrolases family 16 [Mucilaginibacter mallensis]
MKRAVTLFFITLCFNAAIWAQSTSPVNKPVTLLGAATWDNPDQPFGRRRPVAAADKVSITLYRSGKIPAFFFANFGGPTELASDWAIQSDDNSTLKSCRIPASVTLNGNGLILETLAVTGHKAAWSTGYVYSNFKQHYGYFECRMKAAHGAGINNAFWLTTDDSFEIDITEVKYPNYSHMTLHHRKPVHQAVGFGQLFTDNLSYGYHDYAVLWTQQSLVFAVDGEAVAVMDIVDSIKGDATIRLSTALADFAGKIPTNPVG